ncbi:Protein phosphatase PP2A regulatory subunit B [Bonamia ostreae]|uniref:Protein phosphatase PP2A regulatory subunit B n=1 Tax=Bonamia ostreae TaxID=126728 RepID=A0ABV2AJK7_9EUKA
MKKLNFSEFEDKEMKISISMKKAVFSPKHNLKIKNVDVDIDNRTFFELFSVFGFVLSSKLATDPEGNSNGYGYVNYNNSEKAEWVVKVCNNQKLLSSRLNVTFVTTIRKSFQTSTENKEFTNIFVKNIKKTATKKQLLNEFNRFGQIDSVKIPDNPDGTLKGFALLNYHSHQSAKTAIDNWTDYASSKNSSLGELYVNRALSKDAREKSIKENFMLKKEILDVETTGRNVIFKNLSLAVTKKFIGERLSRYGRIESIELKENNFDERMAEKQQKKCAFVLFASREDAVKAIKSENNKDWKGSQIVATLWMRKDTFDDLKSFGGFVDEEQAFKNSSVAKKFSLNQTVLASSVLGSKCKVQLQNIINDDGLNRKIDSSLKVSREQVYIIDRKLLLKKQ